MRKCKLCNTELRRLYYYYGDTFNTQGMSLVESESISKKLYVCPECGLVYALKNGEISNEKRDTTNS